MSDEPKLGPVPSPAVPLMAPEKARDIARGLKGLADAYADAQMQRQAAAALRDSEWWLRYALNPRGNEQGLSHERFSASRARSAVYPCKNRKMPSRRMTVAESLDWDSGDRTDARWQLGDGEPEMMAPGSDAHGSILACLVHLASAHFEAKGSQCRTVV